MLLLQLKRTSSYRYFIIIILVIPFICPNSINSFSWRQHQPPQQKFQPFDRSKSLSFVLNAVELPLPSSGKQQPHVNSTTTLPTDTFNYGRNDDSIIWKIRPCEHPTPIEMLHWYICGIVDVILVDYHRRIRNSCCGENTKSNNRSLSSPYFLIPSSTTRQRFSFLLNLDPRSSHTETRNHQMVVLLATIPTGRNKSNRTTGSSTTTQRILFPTKEEIVVGRFGIVSEPGPIVPPPLQEAIHRIYGNNSNRNSTNIHPNTHDIRAGAIVYMFVEPEYRGIHNNIGGQALEVIHTIQRFCYCTYNILVANDKTPSPEYHNMKQGCDNDDRYGSMKLVQWYRRNGYHIAEEIQDMLGSPNGIYGIAMITSLYHSKNNRNRNNQGMNDQNTNHPIIQWW